MLSKFKIKLRRFIARNFSSVVEAAYIIKIGWQRFKKPPIIILTPGKVGSSTVYKTLKKSQKNSIYHIHRLSKKGIRNSEIEHLESDRNSRPLHLIIGKQLRKKLDEYKDEIKVITIVREPISRAISAFFQNTEFYKSEVEKNSLQIDEEKALELLLNRLDSSITSQLHEWFDYFLKWKIWTNIFRMLFKTFLV